MDAGSVKNVAEIIRNYPDDRIVVVVSAMGKTTNALERLTHAFYYKKEDAFAVLEEVREFHLSIIKELFEEGDDIFKEVHNTLVEIEWTIEDDPIGDFDFEYDQIVSMGELLSTKIINAYLKKEGIPNQWLDIRDVIRTDNTYRNAGVDWSYTREASEKFFFPENSESDSRVMVTQGFIGGTSENYTTTLGREGSDYTAAIIASVLNADSVTVWKDVPGILNADPKYFEDTVKLRNISYQEAVELAFYGAKVIHPKTIKPLQNQKIPLYVKSFINSNEAGTVIDHNINEDNYIPSFIFRVDQVLISISPRDYSFMVEENLSEVFGKFASHNLNINLMQNSAISFSVCLDEEKEKLQELLKELKEDYKVLYNEGLELLTVRHYTDEVLDELTSGKEILVEQKSRHTARFVLR